MVYRAYTAPESQLKIVADLIGMNTSQDAVLKMKDRWAIRPLVSPLFFFRAGDSLDFCRLTQQ